MADPTLPPPLTTLGKVSAALLVRQNSEATTPTDFKKAIDRLTQEGQVDPALAAITPPRSIHLHHR